MKEKTFASTVLLLLAVLGLSGCGTLVDMGRNDPVDPRRIYLNDRAANDSLPATLATEGLLLVMQPGSKQYTLRTSSGNAADQLDLYVRNSTGGFSFQQTLAGSSQSGAVDYTLQAPTSKIQADYYLVFLRGTAGASATVPTDVRLTPVDTTSADTVKVRLHMVRQLEGLSTSAAKAAYATAFHTELRSIYSTYGITVDTSTAIVDSAGDPMTVTFNGATEQFPGTRRSGAINIYLVNSIDGGGEGTVVVGFAPREAFDLSNSEDSRVVLNVQGSDGSIGQKAASMAVTAAHEMGHFIGFRHTSATEGDRSYDDDESNRDDGFASTPFCAMLTKPSASQDREISIKGPGDRPYCLRIAGTAFTCGCSDVTNLMYPYKCNTTQKTLMDEQQVFLRNNLKIFQ